MWLLIYFFFVGPLLLLLAFLYLEGDRRRATEHRRSAERWASNPPPHAEQDMAQLGFVSLYDERKGWGFVQGQDGRSYFFPCDSIQEERQPEVGQFVYFFPSATKQRAGKRRTAVAVRLVAGRENERHISTRMRLSNYVVCRHCGHRMTPRGSVGNQHCPFCGSAYRYQKLSFKAF